MTMQLITKLYSHQQLAKQVYKKNATMATGKQENKVTSAGVAGPSTRDDKENKIPASS